MPRATIEIEAFPCISPEGVYATVYIGDAGEPSLEVTECWENILENEIDYHTVPNGDKPIVVSSGNDGVQSIQETVEMFRDLADRLESKMREHPIFLRDKWVEASNPETGEGQPASNFYVNYEDYLNYKLGYGE